jgi:hypothetical protein
LKSHFARFKIITIQPAAVPDAADRPASAAAFFDSAISVWSQREPAIGPGEQSPQPRLDVQSVPGGNAVGDRFEVNILPTYERLDRNFTISPGITFPIGNEYTFRRYRVQLQTANRRVIAVSPTIEEGSFYSGDRRKVAIDVTVRARPGVIVYLSGEWNRIQLAEGRFETRLFRVVPELQFSPWLSLVNTIQYDSVSAVVG